MREEISNTSNIIDCLNQPGDWCKEPYIDPFFISRSSRALRFPPPCGSTRMLEHLDCLIRAAPNDLLHHVRKIVLCRELNEAAHLGAALADLFIVLQQHGVDLKNRLLAVSRSHLPMPLYWQLAKSLRTNPITGEEDWLPDESLLKCFYPEANADFIKRNRSHQNE